MKSSTEILRKEISFLWFKYSRWVLLKAYLLILLLSVGCSKTTTSGPEFSGVGSLPGTWNTPCLAATSGSVKSDVNFTGGAYSANLYFYSDSVCNLQSYKMAETGNIAASSIDLSGKGTIDWTLSSFMITPITSAQVTSWNGSSYCGFTDWAVGVTKSVLSKTCGTQSIPAAGTVDYDVYNIDQYSFPPYEYQGRLTFGAKDSLHDGTTPDKRPTMFDSSIYYNKQ